MRAQLVRQLLTLANQNVEFGLPLPASLEYQHLVTKLIADGRNLPSPRFHLATLEVKNSSQFCELLLVRAASVVCADSDWMRFETWSFWTDNIAPLAASMETSAAEWATTPVNFNQCFLQAEQAQRQMKTGLGRLVAALATHSVGGDLSGRLVAAVLGDEANQQDALGSQFAKAVKLRRFPHLIESFKTHADAVLQKMADRFTKQAARYIRKVPTTMVQVSYDTRDGERPVVGRLSGPPTASCIPTIS